MNYGEAPPICEHGARANQISESEPSVRWPRKAALFGVDVSITTYDECVDAIMQAASQRVSGTVTCHPVHALMCAVGEESLARKVNAFDVVAPDGQPVRWALNWLHGARLTERVYGPELMLRLCCRAAEDGISIYLYGSRPEVIERLQENLRRRIPGLLIVGAESPPFRELTPEEDEQMIRRINASRAGLVFIGLGSPKQDRFVFDHRDTIQGVQLCVGAAFDFHAGTLKMAPRQMQRHGLEWIFRLAAEPRRLWKRYLVANSTFLVRLLFALAFRKTPAR